MRLEITPSEETLLRGLTSTEYIWTTLRLHNHTIFTSDELFDKWEEYFSQKGQLDRFNMWFAQRISSMEEFIKLPMHPIDDIAGVESDKDKIIIATAKSSKDKIVIGVGSSNARIKNKEITFITNKNFNKEKQQTITFSDISNVLEGRTDKIFDIHETPISLKVIDNGDSNVLRDYLSIFINGTKSLYVKDAYLWDSDNQNNFKNYILPLVDKANCEITLEMTWGDFDKRTMEEKLGNYNGYNISLKGCKNDDKHSSFIRTDKFEIILGYRLKIFGINNDGKTKAENITINKI